MIPEARRLEELSLNSSTPPGQRLYDGWLLRFSPGRAKRARSVNALYPSRLPLDGKIAHCERAYAAAGLPAIFRITPFSEPAGLDAALAGRGYGRFDTTAVESARLPGPGPGGRGMPLALDAWVEALGGLCDSPPAHRRGHLARLAGLGLPLRPVAIIEDGAVVATGLAVLEDDWAGLFDIATAPSHRGRGLGAEIVATLLATAWELGARQAYLQVSEDNAPARRLYRRFGFEERYAYWYRAREGERH